MATRRQTSRRWSETSSAGGLADIAIRRAVALARLVDAHAAVIFALVMAGAFALILWIGRHGSFFQDEWAFVDFEGFGTVRDWFTPHNEHWSTLPFLAYRTLIMTVGLRSYLPYLALLLMLHLLVSGALFVILRRSSGSLVALVGATFFVFLGSAWQNLLWAFQIGFVGSTAAGLWALVLLDRVEPGSVRRAIAPSILVLASIMSSGMRLAFLAAAAVEATLNPRRRSAVPWLAFVGAIFLAWFVAFGRAGTAHTVFTVEAIPTVVARGIIATVDAVTGHRCLTPGSPWRWPSSPSRCQPAAISRPEHPAQSSA